MHNSVLLEEAVETVVRKGVGNLSVLAMKGSAVSVCLFGILDQKKILGSLKMKWLRGDTLKVDHS